MSFHDFPFYPGDLMRLVVNLQVSKHVIKVRGPSNDGLVHVSLVHLENRINQGRQKMINNIADHQLLKDDHLEVVEGGHQIVQFGSGGGGAGCVGKHRGVGVSGGLNLFLVQYLLFLYFLGSGDQDM